MPPLVRYRYPTARGETVETPIPTASLARRIGSCARNYGYRRGWLIRCRYRRGVLRVTRVV